MRLLLLVLLAGCASPQLPARVVEEADPLVLIAAVAPPQGSELELSVTVVADEATDALPDEPLAVDVFRPQDLSPAGLPMLHRSPVSRWVHPTPAAWPVTSTMTVAAVAGAQLVAWLDVDRSGSISPGDRVGPAVPLSEAEEAGDGLRVVLEVGGILTTVAASPRRVDVDATVVWPGEVVQGRLKVLGYPAASVGPGGPSGRPLVQWSSPGTRRVQDEVVTLRLPVQPPLWLMAGVDGDADGALDAGDPITRPVEGYVAGEALRLEMSAELDR